MPNFQFLYSFTSPKISVVEIQRLDQPAGAPLSDIYKWLVLPASEDKVFEFDFKAMAKAEDYETRTFVEGDLRFNQQGGSLKLLGEEHPLASEDLNSISHKKRESIKSYLSANYELDSFRPLRPSDIAYFKEWVLDPEVIRYSMTKFHRISNVEKIVDWFNSTLFDSKTFQLGIIDPSSKELIGYAGIAGLNEVDGNGEYFIFIGNKSYWGKGIASEVTKHIIKSGFETLNLHRIFLTASSKNPGAIRAYEKAGFVHEGKMREAFFRNNEYSDKIIMGILKSEFEAKI